MSGRGALRGEGGEGERGDGGGGRGAGGQDKKPGGCLRPQGDNYSYSMLILIINPI